MDYSLNSGESKQWEKKELFHKRDLQLNSRGLYYYYCELQSETEISPKLYSKLTNVSYGREIGLWIDNMLNYGYMEHVPDSEVPFLYKA